MKTQREMFRTSSWWLCLHIMASCAPSPDPEAPALATDVSAIIGGTPDTVDPGVVALIVGPGSIRCTATVIAPRVIITAAHCLLEWRSLSLTVAIGNDATVPDRTVEIVDALRHPDFTFTSTLERDVGVALLAEPVTVPAWPIRRAPIDDALIGREVRLVGYGSSTHEEIDPNFARLEGTTIVDGYDDDAISYGAMPAATCHGDSGGPNFISDGTTEYLLAVTSSGNSACTRGWGTRLDIQAETFIDPYVARSELRTASSGERCYFDGHCATGQCVAALDQPALRFCSDFCAEQTDCANGMKCQAGLCRWLAPSPGVTGTVCSSDHDCLSDICAAGASGEATRCAEECQAEFDGEDLAFTCPGDAECVESDTIRNRRYCIEGSGCGCASGRADGALVIALLAWLPRRGRRRRRNWISSFVR
jgi:hypothetical protein